jgi:hypothetical protein
MHAVTQVDWNAVYAIGALGVMLGGIAWRMSRRFSRLEGKVDLVARGQRHLRRLFGLHDRRLRALEQGPSAPPSLPGPFAAGAEGEIRYRRFPVVEGFGRAATSAAGDAAQEATGPAI